MFDLARFLSHCVDGDVRRACERRVLDHFYERLCERHRTLHNAAPAFSREEVGERRPSRTRKAATIGARFL